MAKEHGGRQPAERSAGKGLKGSLTAMGTAAVLGIYAAGYARTEGAARQMEEELAARRVASAPPVVRLAGSSPPVEPASSQAPGVPGAALPAQEVAGLSPDRAGEPATRGLPEPSLATSAPEAAAAQVPAPGPVVPPEPPTPESPYKDGVYASSGWETRHGHVDVRVEIVEGRIASASVLYCGMRWPCTDVNALIAQVPQMQTSEVGMISGATQTSEAFTSAVANALSLARAARTAPAAQ